MVNRLEGWLDREEVPADYWIVSSEVGNIPVSTVEARKVLEALGAADARPWVVFQDLFGSCYRIRPHGIDAVWESTPRQRQRRRQFNQERREEADNDCNPWDEE